MATMQESRNGPGGRGGRGTGLVKMGVSFRTNMRKAYEHDDEGTAAASQLGVVTVMNKVNSAFYGAMTSHYLAKRVETVLSQKGYAKETTLFATSLCCDEVNRDLEDHLKDKYGNNFSMGGLAGFAFGGVTSFGAMAHHIPDDGNCLILYGPHVGIDWDGKVGKVNRRGRPGSGACCGSATAALGYVQMVRSGERLEAENPDDCLDAQQTWVGKALLPHGDRLEEADSVEVELPMALFDCQDDLMKRIVAKGAGEVGGDGKIALLGGIQINTPEGTPEYFLPKKFNLLNNKGEIVEDLLPDLAV